MKSSDMTVIDRMDVTLWRVYSRWCETQTPELETAFRRRLKDYEQRCDAERAQIGMEL